MFNEWFAKDTSRKIRSVFHSKGMSGQRVSTQAPYGYIKGTDGHLVIDEETAPVVELIFQLCVEGNGPSNIARILKERNTPTPGTIESQRTGRTRRYHPDNPCHWNADTIIGILEQDAYLGRTTNFKTTKLSYKNKKKIENPPEKRVTFENTHKAIIDTGTWAIVQKVRAQRRRPTRTGEVGLFSGLVFCADCGARLYYCQTNAQARRQECYTCGNYRTRKQCSSHYIREVVLHQLVLQNLQRILAYAQYDEDEFVHGVMLNKSALQRTERERGKRELEKQERRINELDTLIQRLYEDHVSGKLTAERFGKLSDSYEQEQANLKRSTKALRSTTSEAETKEDNVQEFLKIVRKYTEPSELTPEMLRELVEKVVVHAPDKSSGHRVQRIDVYYNFIGEVDFSPEYVETGRGTAV